MCRVCNGPALGSWSLSKLALWGVSSFHKREAGIQSGLPKRYSVSQSLLVSYEENQSYVVKVWEKHIPEPWFSPLHGQGPDKAQFASISFLEWSKQHHFWIHYVKLTSEKRGTQPKKVPLGKKSFKTTDLPMQPHSLSNWRRRLPRERFHLAEDNPVLGQEGFE